MSTRRIGIGGALALTIGLGAGYSVGAGLFSSSSACPHDAAGASEACAMQAKAPPLDDATLALGAPSECPHFSGKTKLNGSAK